MQYFENIKKNFGFGCMRLPMKGDEVDTAEVCRMADECLARGFNYFDTAHGYLGGKSEIAVKECLTSRHPQSPGRRYLPDGSNRSTLKRPRGSFCRADRAPCHPPGGEINRQPPEKGGCPFD